MKLVVCVVVLLCSISSAVACDPQCAEVWLKYTEITPPSITTPLASSNGCGINAEVPFSCSVSIDQDYHKKTDCTQEYPYDTLTYTWTKTGGSWTNGVNTGRNVTWIAPSNPGNHTVTVTVSDAGVHGTDDDPNRFASRDMEVIRLDKVRLYFYCDGTAFPRANTQSFDTRAVVWATVTEQHVYCDLAMNPTVWAWWCPGSDEFRGDQTPPHWWENPEPHFPQDGTILD